MPLRPDFAAHRKALLDRLADDEAVLLLGAPHYLRNGDTEYKYRPDSDVFWLTGWEDPEVAVFLRPGEEPFTLFVQPKDRAREIWTGFRPGPEGAVKDYGADAEKHGFDALADRLGDVVAGDSEGWVLLWDGWGPFARLDERAFSVALSVLGGRVNADRGGPFVVVLRGEGPDLEGVPSLD